MKLKELRIDNWVKGDTGLLYKIGLSDFADWYNDHNSHEYGEHVHPVELTEEWLIKTKCEKDGVYYIKDRFQLLWRQDYKFWYIFDKESKTYMTKVEFVHEWQNFYFIMNGEELIYV